MKLVIVPVMLVMLLAGATFTAQGLGLVRGQSYLGRSFMVGDPTWAAIGTAMVAASLVGLWRTVRTTRRRG